MINKQIKNLFIVVIINKNWNKNKLCLLIKEKRTLKICFCSFFIQGLLFCTINDCPPIIQVGVDFFFVDILSFASKKIELFKVKNWHFVDWHKTTQMTDDVLPVYLLVICLFRSYSRLSFINILYTYTKVNYVTVKDLLFFCVCVIRSNASFFYLTYMQELVCKIPITSY